MTRGQCGVATTGNLKTKTPTRRLFKDSINTDGYTGQTFDSYSWKDKAGQRETSMCYAVGTQFKRYCLWTS